MSSTSPRQAARQLNATTVHPGKSAGRALFLDEPLSFWGGLDLQSGTICDASHPQFGSLIRDRILIMESGRGSSSSASTLAEAIRLHSAPAGIILNRTDPILAIGALVAADLYDISLPIVVVGPEEWRQLQSCSSVTIDAISGSTRLILD